MTSTIISSGVQGLEGAQGPPGNPGVDGRSAFQVAVDNGFVGSVEEWESSLVGSVGATGPVGPTGPSGGPTGATGPVGASGADGLVGEMGPTGPEGPSGVPGLVGPAGVDGEVGPSGPEGPTGPTGPVGDIGPAGEAGATGPAGPTGATGVNGEVGATGPVGASGVSGPVGATGVQGFTGPAGGTQIGDISGLQSVLDGKAAIAHVHSGADVTSGTVAFARLPTGTGSSQVAVGDHTHTAAEVGAAPATRTVGTGLATSGTVNLDMASVHGTIQTVTLSGNATFTTSNRAAGREVTLVLAAGGSSRTLTWPSWLAVGAALPTSLASGKTLVVTVTFVDTTDVAAVAAAAVQP